MKIRKAILLIAALVAFQVEALSVPRCLSRRPVLEELNRATIVFSGKVVAEEYKPLSWSERLSVRGSDLPEGSKVLVVKFAVERWWKGSDDEEVVLHTSQIRIPGGLRSMMAEDFEFRVGEKYLVYAYEKDGRFSTSACARTVEIGKAGDDLKELGEGRLPEKR